MLAALGLDPAEEQAYRLLVAGGVATLDELLDESDLSRSALATAMAGLVGRGLATEQPAPVGDGPARFAAPAGDGLVFFAAAPPAIALGGLLRSRHDDLRAAELAIAALAETYRSASAGRTASDVIEVITDVSAVRHRFAQLQEAARTEVLSLVVPHLSVVPHRENVARDECLRRGVRCRAIIDRRVLDPPGMVGDAIASAAAGLEIRVVDRVPVKAVIVDREVAMLPLRHNQHTAPASVLIHPSGLLDAMLAFYDALWERGYPLLPGSGAGPAEIDEIDGRILALLLSGLTDQAVAGKLGLSLRTVQRRIHDLMARAGVSTRVQLGWHAARKGWA
ncbi:helix-turn-helix domain-containing protein [Actinoplanes sp. CA-142083]|uniref:helix-turn-helix domain-containing protein n=1 Tax=Actinoplanes sp. CA-142083 TaxID=3239903 RepID=UPI003D8F9C90